MHLEAFVAAQCTLYDLPWSCGADVSQLRGSSHTAGG